jgi:hypothetical protein
MGFNWVFKVLMTDLRNINMTMMMMMMMMMKITGEKFKILVNKT